MSLTTYDRIIKENQEIGLVKGKLIGKEEGREEGREEGKEEKQNLIIKKCITKFPQWSDEQIAEFVETDIELVKKIREKLK